MKRIILGLFLVLSLGILGYFVADAQSPGELQHEKIMLASLPVSYFEIDIQSITDRGPGVLKVFRFEEAVELVPHHYKQAGLSAPAHTASWRKHLGAVMVFNAGQFDDKLNHLGWLKGNGHWYSKQRKEAWMGVLASGPNDGAYWGRIVDLEHAGPSAIDRYQHVVQSMMLVDEESRVRVRDSDKSASRTVVAEDKNGRLLVMFSEGAVTLADLAEKIPKLELGILRAMNLDGGIESQFSVHDPNFQKDHFGRFSPDGSALAGQANKLVKYPIPAVIAIQKPNTPQQIAK